MRLGRRSPWVDGVGVAGVVEACGTTTHGSAAAAWLGRRVVGATARGTARRGRR